MGLGWNGVEIEIGDGMVKGWGWNGVGIGGGMVKGWGWNEIRMEMWMRME